MKPNQQQAIQHLDRWRQLKLTLERESRFYNSSVVEELEFVFGKPGSDEKHLCDLYNDPSVVRVVSSDTEFNIFRARHFGSINSVRKALLVPDRELARPPFSIARAGRMNADGIAVFYGATDMQVALAEIRPPVGSSVVVSRFCVSKGKEIRLLDVEAFGRAYENYVESDEDMETKLDFIKSFGDQVTKPVVPENESKEYIITQVISDYLSSRRDIDIHGFIYKSTQTNVNGHKNIVLFHRSSEVEYLGDDRVGLLIERIESNYSDIFENDVSIDLRKSYEEYYDSDDYGNNKNPTLELDIGSVSLYQVQDARFDTNPKMKTTK